MVSVASSTGLETAASIDPSPASSATSSTSVVIETTSSVTTAPGPSTPSSTDATSESVATVASSETSDGNGSSTEASSAAAPPSPLQFAGALEGLLFKGECATGEVADECHPGGCVDNVFEQKTSVTLGGDVTTVYALEIHVYGVVEVRKGYVGGARRRGTTSNAESERDFWYEGGHAESGNYNVYSLRVTPAVPDVPNADAGGNNYFLNARDESNEGHEVWALDYTATIHALGGSEVEFRAYDQNCTQIQNVGSSARPTRGSGTDGALVVDAVSSADPPPAGFAQPLSTNGRNGQWIYIDVLSVSEVE
jgi:hypothetical protein